MINTFFLEGVVTKTSELKKDKDGVAYGDIAIKTERSFKNEKGEYDCDIFNIKVWRGIAEVCLKDCSPGTLLGIQGHIQTATNANEGYEFVAEKVSFLGPCKNDGNF